MRIAKLIGATLEGQKFVLQFETGERRYFNVEALLGILNKLSVENFNSNDLKKSEINEDGILTFPTVQIKLTTHEGTKHYPYDLDPDFVYNESIGEENSIGQIFKEMRLSQKLTQEEVAKKCDTTKGYISKFENNNIQVEWNTLRKLFFMGLSMKITPSSLVPIQTSHPVILYTSLKSSYIEYGSSYAAQEEITKGKNITLSAAKINKKIEMTPEGEYSIVSEPVEFSLQR